ncbi:MAG TPA: SAM hydroxide adenosyltransferase, partial [Chroococcales cyanobacterium]
YGPVAAHLANGLEPTSVGREIAVSELVSLAHAPLSVTETGVAGQVIYVDRFGNLITNIPNRYVAEGKHCYLGGQQLCSVGQTYSSARSGEPASFAGSHGCLEICIFQGNASKALNAERRTPVSLESAT